MQWQGRRESDNVEDRRSGGSGPGLAVGGGIGTVVLVVIVLLLGGDPRALLQRSGTGTHPESRSVRTSSVEDEQLKKFVSVVLADTEDAWNGILKQNGRRYSEPKLVLFTGQVRSACGQADAAVGPFYCSGDEKLYIDLSFYRELKERFQAPGDFAQAYVIAHEVGHHIQHLLGTMDKVHSAQTRMSKADANALSVRLELQADFYAGVWAHYAKQKGVVEPGDIEEALKAASAIGDDRLQKEAQGYVVPDSFTHGTSAQRVRWFRKGFETGDLKQGDTFNAKSL